MRAWTTAAVPGQCAYESGHRWDAGARIFRVQGVTWTKDYCQTCASKYQNAGDDSGEVLDLTDAPGFPKGLK